MKEIPLKPFAKGAVALVDDCDFEYLNQWVWSAVPHQDGSVYARRTESINGKRKWFAMHRVVLALAEGVGGVDHKDLNSLNNQRHNLRKANDHQNGGNRDANSNNTSGYKGVTWSKPAKKWQAQIMVHRKHRYLGLFENPVEAAKRYDMEAVLCFGEFAKTSAQLGRLVQ